MLLMLVIMLVLMLVLMMRMLVIMLVPMLVLMLVLVLVLVLMLVLMPVLVLTPLQGREAEEGDPDRRQLMDDLKAEHNGGIVQAWHLAPGTS